MRAAFWGWFLGGVLAVVPVFADHGVSLHGHPKYGKNFSHFDYVNPDAPKRGMLTQAASGSFDTFNPFVISGMSAAGILLTHDTLMKQSADEAFSLYGLIADDIYIDPSGHFVSFHLNPKARFSDGSPITAKDVVFSFRVLKEKGVPTYRYYYGDVEGVEIEDSQTVRFLLKKDSPNKELPLILGELPILSEKWWSGRAFEKTSLDVPVSSGPYLIEAYEPGRFISYRFNPDYWAKELNVNKGFYNFEQIRYEYYRDTSVIMEAFKSGLIDVRQETEARRWRLLEKDSLVRDGKIVLSEMPHHLPSGMQGFVFNLRRPIFADSRVRRALGLVFDFDWTNQTLFHGLYKRTESFFDNSDLKAPFLPSDSEKRLLKPFEDQLSPRVFSQGFKVDESASARDKLRKALDLLEEAGWRVAQDGVLKNAEGHPFSFEILLDSVSVGAWERITLPFVGRLKRLGIEARVRVVDPMQYKTRLDKFDFDMIVSVWGQSLSPGNEQRYFWGSAAADTPGSANYAGVKSNVVDFLIEKIITAETRADLQTAVQALDRVLLWSYLVIPHWYAPVQRFAFQKRLRQPSSVPLKGADILTWWIEE